MYCMLTLFRDGLILAMEHSILRVIFIIFTQDIFFTLKVILCLLFSTDYI